MWFRPHTNRTLFLVLGNYLVRELRKGVSDPIPAGDEGEGDEADAAGAGDDGGAMDLEDLIERKDISSQLDGLVAM